MAGRGDRRPPRRRRPGHGQVLTTVAEADAADVAAAVAAAREAFDTGPWPRMPARDRARILHRVADLIRERADELVALESLDVGKPVTLCRAVDVETAAQQYEYCSALAQSLDGATRRPPIPAYAYTRASRSAWSAPSPRSTSR